MEAKNEEIIERRIHPGLEGPDSSGSTAATAEEILRHDLEFRVRYNIFLHEDCASHYRRLELAYTSISLALGIASIANLYGAISQVVICAMGCISVFAGIVSVVYRLSDRAREYSCAVEFYRRLLGRIRNGCSMDDLEEERREYDGFDVPGRINAVTEAASYDMACVQMGEPEHCRYGRISPFIYHTRFIFPWRTPVEKAGSK